MSTTKPLLKWVGGKTQILDTVLSRFPTAMTNYHEPFVGGGSVLLGLLSRVRAGSITVSGHIVVSDVNANLIGFYTTVQSRPAELLAELKALADVFLSITGTTVNRKATTLEEAKTSRESYYFWIRSSFNRLTAEERTTPRAAAMLLFMNKTCFRGVYREGPHGFNVPYGNYKQPTLVDEAHIQEVSALLQGVVFQARPFGDALAEVGAGDFVYLDPPYAPETDTSFVSYTADGFGLEAHQSLFGLCKALRSKGVSFLMSNADVKLVRDAFPATEGYSTAVVECRRAIHSKRPETKTKEVLVRASP